MRTMVCCAAGMVYNATSWGAKLLMQAAYNTKARLLAGLLMFRRIHSHVWAHVLGINVAHSVEAVRSLDMACTTSGVGIGMPPADGGRGYAQQALLGGTAVAT